MKLAICNEIFGDMPFDQAFALAAKVGYTGVEIAPFTLNFSASPFDAGSVTAERKTETILAAKNAGLEVLGLHWLLAKTEGFYLTSPDAAVRKKTADYMVTLIELCGELGGKLMVLGSPPQRNLLLGVSHEEAEKHAADVLAMAMPACVKCRVTIALEPLGPTEGDFLNTAASAIQLAQRVDSPHCKLHLDVKAMSSESVPIPQIIQDSRDWMVHFHANDANLLGPGMGDIDFHPILTALDDVAYDGWLSVEVFKFDLGPEVIARQSLDYLKKVQADLVA